MEQAYKDLTKKGPPAFVASDPAIPQAKVTDVPAEKYSDTIIPTVLSAHVNPVDGNNLKSDLTVLSPQVVRHDPITP